MYFFQKVRLKDIIFDDTGLHKKTIKNLLYYYSLQGLIREWKALIIIFTNLFVKAQEFFLCWHFAIITLRSSRGKDESLKIIFKFFWANESCNGRSNRIKSSSNYLVDNLAWQAMKGVASCEKSWRDASNLWPKNSWMRPLCTMCKSARTARRRELKRLSTCRKRNQSRCRE